MAAHAAYRWEQDQFRWAYDVEIDFKYRSILTKTLARMWGIGGIDVTLDRRSISRGGSWIVMLPSEGNRCSLGVIVHELAHTYNMRKLGGGNEHTGTFRRAVIKLQCEVKRMLPAAFRVVRATLADQQEAGERAARVVQRNVERRKATVEKRATRSFRIEQAKKRIKLLTTRKKRIETAIRKQTRRLRTLERLEAKLVDGQGFTDRSALNLLQHSAQPSLG